MPFARNLAHGAIRNLLVGSLPRRGVSQRNVPGGVGGLVMAYA